VVLQQGIYCGVPAANTAFEALSEVVAEVDPPGRAAER
jgi:alkylhydroperoxidase/carboxymuconolactone decarboxylase family protein YurZ